MSSSGFWIAFAIPFLAPGVALTVLIMAVALAFWLVPPRLTGGDAIGRIGLVIGLAIALTIVALVVLGQLIEGAQERCLRRTGSLDDRSGRGVRVLCAKSGRDAP